MEFYKTFFSEIIFVNKVDKRCQENQCNIHMKESINMSNKKSHNSFLRVSKRAKDQT